MSGVLEAKIMSNPVGRWYIEISDEAEDTKEYCLDFSEFEKKIAILGDKYGGDIEVAWSSDENVTKEQINEVRMSMLEYEARIAEEDKLSANPFGAEESGFNPNG